MENKSTRWQQRFGLTICPAVKVESAILATALGVAVIYAATPERDEIFLVLESRSGSLRDLCLKRLATAKLPPAASLTVAFKGEILSGASPEAVNTACREQVLFAGEMRRELRPAMR